MIKLKSIVTEIAKEDRLTLVKEFIEHVSASSPINYYIKNYKPLSSKEENELIAKYQKTKDSKAFDSLIKAHSKYMLKMIMKNKDKLEKIDQNLTTEEVFNAMVMNFARAINKFDVTKGYKFSTYLDKWLREVILNYKNFITKSAKIIGNKSTSIDTKIGKGGDNKQRTLSDLIADPNQADMYSEKKKSDFMRSLIKKGFKALNNKEKFIIKAKYGLINDPKIEDKLLSKKGKITNKTIGAYLGTSGQYVRGLHISALKKLKKALN